MADDVAGKIKLVIIRSFIKVLTSFLRYYVSFPQYYLSFPRKRESRKIKRLDSHFHGNDDCRMMFYAPFFIICLILTLISPANAEKVNYFYDDLGRLIKAVSETGDAAIYNYDSVGNFLSISRETTKPIPPVLNSITPDVVFPLLFEPKTLAITITGENLLATERLFSDNSGVIINSFAVIDTSIMANITVLSSASGATNINVKTSYGSASIPLSIARLNFSPAQITVLSGTTTDVSARIDGLSRDYTIDLNNQTPNIISAPQTITIPSGGSVNFTVNALAEGTGTIAAENAGISVYVTQPFTGTATSATKPVSVVIKQQTQGITATAPVSVKISSVIQGVTTTAPVSVKVLQNITGTSVSNPVSIKKENQ